MAERERPNVVLVLTDTQGLNAVGEVGGAGRNVIDTPTLDQLADEGVSCGSMYAGSPVCGPSRACLFTGMYPHRAGCWTNAVPLYQGVQTMGTYFADAGYRTAYVGKWHLDGDYMGDGEAPEPYEQEYWYDGQNYREEMGDEFYDWWWSEGMLENHNAEHSLDALRDRGITREDTWAGRIVDRARAFIDDVEDDQPYFLVVSIDEPHEPSLCPPEYAERYVDDPPSLPDNYESLSELADKPDHHRRRAEEFRNGEFFIDSISNPETGVIDRPTYFSCAEFADAEIGRLIEAVDAHAETDTVVTFTSDHGHHLGAHGLDSKWATAYDETVNVPFIVRYPAELPSGVLRDSVASHVDLLPTLLDLADATEPGSLDIDGRSMRPLLESGQSYREAALIQYHAFSARNVGADGLGLFPMRTLVEDEHKLVVNLFETDELYDRVADPGEVTNRIEDPEYGDARDRMFSTIIERMDATVDPFDGRVWADRHWAG